MVGTIHLKASDILILFSCLTVDYIIPPNVCTINNVYNMVHTCIEYGT